MWNLLWIMLIAIKFLFLFPFVLPIMLVRLYHIKSFFEYYLSQMYVFRMYWALNTYSSKLYHSFFSFPPLKLQKKMGGGKEQNKTFWLFLIPRTRNHFYSVCVFYMTHLNAALETYFTLEVAYADPDCTNTTD